MNKTISITKAREEFPKIIDRTNRLLEKYIVTVNGKNKAVIMSVDEYNSLQETLDILSDPGALDDIKQAEKELAEGKYVTLDELKNKLAF